MSEIWRSIPSLPEYLASSEGRIMRLPYLGPMPTGGQRAYGGEPWFGVWEKRQGRFTLVHDGRTYRVARLVCEAFHGPAPEEAPYCLHCDENAANNKPANLVWGTQEQNLNAPGFIAYCKGRVGANHPGAKARRRSLLAEGPQQEGSR